MVPEGWLDNRLGERIKLASGSARPADTVSHADKTNAIPVYGGNGILGYSTESNLQGDAVVIGRVGEKCGITRYVQGPMWVSDNALYSREIAPDTHIEFLTYRLQHFDLSRLRKKGGQPLITQKPIYDLRLPFPPLPEQKKIADILSTWDKAIETTEKLLANAEKQKRALMEQLLTGRQRLKGFAGEWKEVAVGSIGQVVGGGTPDSENSGYWNGNIAWATPTDITRLRSRFICETARTLSDSGLKNSAARAIPPGSLLVCTRATVGELAISSVEITTNQGFKSLIPNREHDVEFLYYLCSQNKHKLVRLACGSTFLELSKRDFELCSFRVPTRDEQTAIAGVLNVATEQTERLRDQIGVLTSEKRALMQELLSGKRRVSV